MISVQFVALRCFLEVKALRESVASISPLSEMAWSDLTLACLFCNKTLLLVVVLCDESMHGMQKAMNTIRNIDKEAPFPFKSEQGASCVIFFNNFKFAPSLGF